MCVSAVLFTVCPFVFMLPTCHLRVVEELAVLVVLRVKVVQQEWHVHAMVMGGAQTHCSTVPARWVELLPAWDWCGLASRQVFWGGALLQPTFTESGP
jgi:hypothetical protein